MYKLIVGSDHPIVTKSCRRFVRIYYIYISIPRILLIYTLKLFQKLIGRSFHRIRYHIDMNKEIGASIALVQKDSYVDYINSTIFNKSAI